MSSASSQRPAVRLRRRLRMGLAIRGGKNTRSTSAQVRKFLCRTRLGYVKPLGEAYAQTPQFGEDLRRLHPFGDGLNAHGVADLADGRDHAAVDRIAGHVLDELAVDLQIVDGQGLQVHER